MRVMIAGIIGGLAMFLWGAISHTMLPVGEVGIKVPTAQNSAMAALGLTTQGAGVYMYPSPSREDWQDEAKMKLFAQSTQGQPYAFVVYQPGGNPVNTSMGPNLVTQWASDTLGALVAAWILALGAFGFGKRMLVAGALGVFAWLAISVPYWNWYMFPTDFTVANLVEQAVGWLLSGAAMAWWLGRKERS